MSDTLPFSQFKANLSQLADRVERQHHRIIHEIFEDDEVVLIYGVQHRRNAHRHR